MSTSLLDNSISSIDEQFWGHRNKNRKTFGYWRRSFDSKYNDLPFPTDFTDHNWDIGERNKLIDILKTANVDESWLGWSNCRICGKMNGSKCMELNGLVFPEGLSHYIEEHDLRPPEEILKIIYEKSP